MEPRATSFRGYALRDMFLQQGVCVCVPCVTLERYTFFKVQKGRKFVFTDCVAPVSFVFGKIQ